MTQKLTRRGPEFYRYLWRLSLPMILQNLITFSLGLIDTFMVSRLGNTQMAAVTTANVPVFLLISIVFGAQSGLGIIVSQYWGKKDLTNISRALGVASLLGTGLTLLLGILFLLFPVPIMDLLSNNHELSVLGAPYLRIIGFSYVFNMLSSIYVSAQRSVENPHFGMKLFGFSTVLNTALNFLLIYGKCGLHWGFRARQLPPCWRVFPKWPFALSMLCAAKRCPWICPLSSVPGRRCCAALSNTPGLCF